MLSGHLFSSLAVALVGVLVLVADGAGGLQLALEITLRSISGVALEMMTSTPMSARKLGRKPGRWPGLGTDSSETIFPPSAT